jgi:hypothetical protein
MDDEQRVEPSKAKQAGTPRVAAVPALARPTTCRYY